MQELRATESSTYTESETPIFTCIRLSVERALDALDGESRQGAGVASFAASSSSSNEHSFTRGRPCGSPASRSARSTACQPA